MFQARSKDSIKRDPTATAPEGRNDLTITKVEGGRSKKGDPQLTFTSTVDNGEGVGTEIKEFFTFGGGFGEEIAWSRLANICDHCGFDFEGAQSIEAFAAQFPQGALRYSADLWHQYQIHAWIDTENRYQWEKFTDTPTDDTPYQAWITVQKHDHDDFDGEKKGPFAVVRDGLDFENIYGPPQNDPEVEFAAPDAGDEVEEYFEEAGEDLF